MLNSQLKKLFIGIFLIAGSAFMIQCDDGTRQQQMEGPETTTETDNQVGQEGATDNFQQERDELVSDLRDLRDDIDGRLDELNTEMESATGEVDQTTQQRYDELTQDRNELDRAIEDLENSTEETWGRVRAEAQNTYDAVRTRFEQAGERDNIYN